jgi:uncharacterized protein (TIGR02646 family)
MINQLTSTFILTAEQITTLNSLLPYSRDKWESGTNIIKDIRGTIGSQLRIFQNGKCCYCGLNYDETGQSQIEHIAPKKGRPTEYPEFSFHELNLAIACQLCNSKTMKGEYNSINVYNSIYSNCTFQIVHPYLNDHRQHYKWSYGMLRVLISGVSAEGRESIRLFKLAEEHRTLARARQRNHEKLVSFFMIPQNILNKINEAINYKY